MPRSDEHERQKCMLHRLLNIAQSRISCVGNNVHTRLCAETMFIADTRYLCNNNVFHAGGYGATSSFVLGDNVAKPTASV